VEAGEHNKSMRGRRGQAVVEFALVLPVLLLLVFGAMEFGRAYFDYHLLLTVARQGARTASLPARTEADVQNTVDGLLAQSGLSENCETTITVTDQAGQERTGGLTDAVEGDMVSVTLTCDFQVVVGSLLPGFSGTVPLRVSCAFRHE